MTNIVITAARRTAVGSFMGSFGSTPAHLLGKAAIEAALAQAQTNDFVLVAGKGHETGQVIGDTILPFNDVTYIAQALGQSEVHHG